jgi:hypothetical protein
LEYFKKTVLEGLLVMLPLTVAGGVGWQEASSIRRETSNLGIASEWLDNTSGEKRANCFRTAIWMIWDWGWNWEDIDVENSTIGIDATDQANGPDKKSNRTQGTAVRSLGW